MVDSPSGSRYTANGSTIDGEYRGYRISGNMAPTLGNASPLQLRSRSISERQPLGLQRQLDGYLGTRCDEAGNHGYDEATDYTLTWQITRRADDSLNDIDAKMVGGTLDGDGTAEVVFTDATPMGDDTITGPRQLLVRYVCDRPSSGGQTGGLTADTFDTSLFKVEFTTLAVTPGIDEHTTTMENAQPLRRPGQTNNTNNASQNDNGLGTPVRRYSCALWRANFGKPAGAGSGLKFSPVPEPQWIVLALCGLIGPALARAQR